MTDQQAFDVGKKIAEAIDKDQSQVLDHTSIGPDSVIIEGELNFAFLGRTAIEAVGGGDAGPAVGTMSARDEAAGGGLLDDLRDAAREDGQAAWMHPSPPYASRGALLDKAADEIERLRARDQACSAMLGAAEAVHAGLMARIDAAPLSAVPVFDGIADLHTAIRLARSAGIEPKAA